MRLTFVILALAGLAAARPQIPTPPSAPPPLPTASTGSSGEPPAPIPPPASSPIPVPVPPSEPAPVPPPPTSSPSPPASSSPVPVPEPGPPASTLTGPPRPTVTGEPGQGAICECGYTYCAGVLMAMKVPWNENQLVDAYCATPDAACPGGTPATDVMSALFICLCGSEHQKLGNELHLLCGCDKCLNIGPDYRGRCESPCSSAGNCASSGGKKSLGVW